MRTLDIDINNRRYLGSKYKLLDFIDTTILENCSNIESVVDLFGGTGVVANYFLNKGKEVYVNDILKSNYNSYQAWFGSEEIDLVKLEKMVNEYNNINSLEEISNYFSDNFSGTYFSANDCKKIGYVREDIERKYNENKINEREKSVLIASLVYSMDRVANTVGHYDAYRKLKDMNDKFIMYMVNVRDKNNGKVHIYNKDSNELVEFFVVGLMFLVM